MEATRKKIDQKTLPESIYASTCSSVEQKNIGRHNG